MAMGKASDIRKGEETMVKMTRRKVLAAAGVTTVVAGAHAWSATDDPPASHPRVFQSIPPRELIHQRHLPNVELMTMDGKKVRFYDDLVKDKKFTINFIFTKCDKACPIITHNLVRVQKLLADRIGHDIFMYSITLSPEEDTPKMLKEYAKEYGVGPGWTFLTGKPDDILLLRRSLGFTYDDPKQDADRNNHIGMIQIGDEPLMRWAHAEGGARPEWIASVIRNEADSPFKGAVGGQRLADPTIHIK